MNSPPADDWRHAIEIHPPGWNCPAEPFWIAGWIMAGNGRTPSDIRAWLGSRLFLGLCGLPRPQIEQEIAGRAGPPHAGFSFLLQPSSGARELRLEACESSGRWTEFHRQVLTIAPGAPASPAPAIDVATTLGRLLALHQAQPQQAWSRLADNVLDAENAVPLDCLPNPPFHGALEQPTGTAYVRFGLIAVTGWLAHREHRIVRLTAFVDPAIPIPLLHGLSRPDIIGEFAGLRDATASRFAGYCMRPAGLPLPACLRIFAELDNGQVELAFARRFRPQAATGTEPVLPRLARFIHWRASWSLAGAARRRRWLLGTPARMREGRRLAWENYRAAARPAAPPKARPEDSVPATLRPLRVTLVTHNLNREGAPLIAFEYARQLAAQPGWRIRIVSPQDGPLRADFLAANLPIKLVDVQPLFAATGPEEFDRAVARLAPAPEWQESDLIIANTMVAFWAVHLARRLGRPSVLYVHESASVRHFFAPFQIPGLWPRIEDAFGLATRTVFSAAATGAVHARLQRRANFRIVPGWIGVDRILAYAAAHSPAGLRRDHRLPGEAVILANIGSVSERKGQRIWAEAIARLLRIRAAGGNPAPPLVFLIVGAAPSFYLDLLRDDLARLQLTGVQIIEQLADAYPYFRLSDIFVCSSFEESLPRVVLEAAAFGLPIVSTNVNGIPEILGPDDAWLVPPGEAGLLAAAMDAALEAHLRGDRTRAANAHRKVCENFTATTLLPRHVRLAAAAAALPAC